MLNQFSRTALLFGKEAIERLDNSRVAIFGIGGVGGYAVEALVRSGVKTFDLFDDDKICLTNLNRQIIATRKTVGKYKVDVMKERILEINPTCKVNTYQTFFLPNNSSEVDFSQFDYVIDAVDTVSAKIELVLRAKEANVPIISAMGAGNKIDPTKFVVTDIYETSVCPLAKVMRHELRKRGIENLKVVYSTEKPIQTIQDDQNSCKTNCICPIDTKRTCAIRRDIPGSNAFVPSVCGLIVAGEVIKDLIKVCN
ncbi:MAG: UBA/THIF-type binding protein [Haloplasmataceae bacterium]|jgi:tRNA A37 threonylcarbamoyladenosine dehydratase|nr:UBA/THIF-type binding protein [Haloplasmataceae bacterium]